MLRTIERIEKSGKYKVRVTFDSEETLFLSVKALKRLGFNEGQEFSEESYDSLLKDEVYPLARKKALDILVRSDRTEKELRERLSYAGFADDAVNQAITYVKGFRYINDGRYAENFTEYRAANMSNLRLRQELRQRGIEDVVIEECLGMRDEEEILKKQIYRKLDFTDISDEKKLKKIRDSFYRKGFSLSDINELMEKYMDSVDK